MEAAERLEAIARQCRPRYYAYPEPLITAICEYASGKGTLAAIQQEWITASSSSPYYPWLFIVISDPAAERLDEIDLRILDICASTGTIRYFFDKIAVAGPVEQTRNYLRAKGIDEASIIDALMRGDKFLDKDGPTALGCLLLSYIPEYFTTILQVTSSRSESASRQALFKLLMLVQPKDYLDLAWQLAQAVPLSKADLYAAELLKADPARFTEWARQVARDSIQHRQSYRYLALEALLELDLARHIDLALEAAQAPLSRSYYSAKLRLTGLQAAYRFDPIKYLPLVEEAVAPPNPSSAHFQLARDAVELLNEADFEQARPILQRCIASNDPYTALKALGMVLKHDWPERQTYMLSLLSHRSKQLRDVLVGWLVKEDESIVEALGPSLAHSNADARLSAVQALQRIGGERARTLLAARLNVEKSLKVKQAILDAIGVAAVTSSSETASASPVEALTTEAEAALKRVGKPTLPWFDAAQAPGLRWKDGEPVPQVILSYLLYLQSRVKLSKLDERIQRTLPLIDRSSAGDLALALFKGWVGHGANTKESWCLPLICVLADERLIHPLRQYIDGWMKTSRGALAAKAVAAMALMESDLALSEINDLAERAKHSLVKTTAQQALTDAAAQSSITLDELSDLIVPRLGFDEKGERVFDYGPRQFTARLLLDHTLQLTDSAGKRLTTLPKPGAKDDQDKAKAALAAWSLTKKQMPQVIKMQVQRLEHALVAQRAWDVGRWQALFLKHPVLRSFAITFVWGVLTPGQSAYHTLFRPLEDGSLTDAEDNTVQLPTQGTIRIAHPIELDEETRSAWLQHLNDYEVTPPFPQLNRPVVRVSSEERTALWWEKYEGYVMNGGALKGRFTKANWERGPVGDGGAYHTIWKAFPAAGIQAVLEITGVSIGYEQELTAALLRLAFAQADTIRHGSYIYDDLKDQDERIIKLGDVPPIIFSEVAANVQNFAAAGEYTEDWRNKIW